MTTVQTATQTSTNETGVTNMIANNLILEVTAEFKKGHIQDVLQCVQATARVVV